LEFMDVDYEIEVDELNERWAQVQNLDEWTQFILKQTEDVTERITRAPASGIWKMPDAGAIHFDRRVTDWHTVADESEAFYLRIAAEGQYRYPGADLGILVTRGRFMNDEHGPHYREWFLREGEEARSSYATSVRMLRGHMPELLPAYERVVELAGGSDLAARMLSLYTPPPYLAACSQGAWTRAGGPLLARNYD